MRKQRLVGAVMVIAAIAYMAYALHTPSSTKRGTIAVVYYSDKCEHAARIIGRELARDGYIVEYVYTSPAYPTLLPMVYGVNTNGEQIVKRIINMYKLKPCYTSEAIVYITVPPNCTRALVDLEGIEKNYLVHVVDVRAKLGDRLSATLIIPSNYVAMYNDKNIDVSDYVKCIEISG